MWENLPICLFVADVDKFTKLWVCHIWKEIYPTEFLQMGEIYPSCQYIIQGGFLSLWVCHRWGKVCPSVSLSRKGENFLSCEIVKDERGSISEFSRWEKIWGKSSYLWVCPDHIGGRSQLLPLVLKYLWPYTHIYCCFGCDVKYCEI